MFTVDVKQQCNNNNNPSTWYICDFYLFHIEIEGKGWWIIGGYVAPPPLSEAQIILGGGGGLPPPLPTPMSLRIAGLSERVIPSGPAGNRSRFDQALLPLVELVRSVG